MVGSLLPLAPHEFTRIPFPVKAIKILIHEIQSGGEAASMSAFAGTGSVPELESDDGVGSSIVSPHPQAHLCLRRTGPKRRGGIKVSATKSSRCFRRCWGRREWPLITTKFSTIMMTRISRTTPSLGWIWRFVDFVASWLHTLTLPYTRPISSRSSRNVLPEIPTTSRGFLTNLLSKRA